MSGTRLPRHRARLHRLQCRRCVITPTHLDSSTPLAPPRRSHKDDITKAAQAYHERALRDSMNDRNIKVSWAAWAARHALQRAGASIDPLNGYSARQIKIMAESRREQYYEPRRPSSLPPSLRGQTSSSCRA